MDQGLRWRLWRQGCPKKPLHTVDVLPLSSRPTRDMGVRASHHRHIATLARVHHIVSVIHFDPCGSLPPETLRGCG